MAAPQPPGELAEEQRLLQDLHPALDRALRRPQVLVEHWAAGTSSSSMGEGQVILVQILVRSQGGEGKLACLHLRVSTAESEHHVVQDSFSLKVRSALVGLIRCG